MVKVKRITIYYKYEEDLDFNQNDHIKTYKKIQLRTNHELLENKLYLQKEDIIQILLTENIQFNTDLLYIKTKEYKLQ